jgi:response regulator RpfG family c-di-GMP phosphodiesterase
MQKSVRKTARSSSTVLVVDQDNARRARARRLLESIGCRVLDAGDTAAAEQIAKLFVGPIHVLLVDVDIAGTSGEELANRLRSLKPELRVLFMSGRNRRNFVKQVRALLNVSSSAK